MGDQIPNEGPPAILTMTRKAKKSVPDNQKDDRYWEKRKRNNMAAKRSRENKRYTEMSIRRKMRLLEEENAVLRKEITVIKSKYGVPADQTFLSEDEKALCRAQVFSASKGVYESPMCRTDEVSSPVSTTSASVPTSPQTDTQDTQFHVDTDEYSPEEGEMRKTPTEDIYLPNKKKLAAACKLLSRRPPVPQALFYGNSYGAQLMWASARTLNPGTLGSNMQQLYQNYSTNNDLVSDMADDHSISHPAEFSRYPTLPRATCTRPFEYPTSYKSQFEYPGVNYDAVRLPTDLSTTRDKYSDENIPAREKRIDYDHTGQTVDAKLKGEPSYSNSAPIRKRRLSDDYIYSYPPTFDQDMRHSQSGSQSGVIHHNSQFSNSSTQWQESRNTSDGQVSYSAGLSRADEFYFEHRQSDQEQAGRLAGPHSQQFSPTRESGHLRKENEDLKVCLRQLVSHVSKMKDIVLPD